MQRIALETLTDWLASTSRKPMVIRGARQVGKTWLVRQLAERSGRRLIELNFEKQPVHANLFNTNDPARILLNLSTLFDQSIDPSTCLLFLDEIQAAPELLARLRWFAEDMPQLPVIATGSLLEFVLAEHDFSMPVGRISYYHLEPLSFSEFLLAQNRKPMLDWLKQYDFSSDMPESLHTECSQLFREYLFVGGMPASVQNWITYRQPNQVARLHHEILGTYRDDFSKYRGRVAMERLEEVMLAVPQLLGQKFVCSRVNPDIPASTIKNVLGLLEKARLCHRVWSTAGNGVPLGAEIRSKYFKTIFVDTGLCCAALHINLNELSAENELALINRGGLAEQVTGQMLRTLEPFYIEPKLYYWMRDIPGASAEIDYLVQHNSNIIPVEVKAGSTGSLKSLHIYMGAKKLTRAIRLNSDVPQKTEVQVKDQTGQFASYTLLSLPFYLAGEIHRLLDV